MKRQKLDGEFNTPAAKQEQSVKKEDPEDEDWDPIVESHIFSIFFESYMQTLRKYSYVI